jgi:hypothetical protein
MIEREDIQNINIRNFKKISFPHCLGHSYINGLRYDEKKDR